jgi:hypothetical protein
MLVQLAHGLLLPAEVRGEALELLMSRELQVVIFGNSFSNKSDLLEYMAELILDSTLIALVGRLHWWLG